MITSPNHPAAYPHNLKMTQHISVKEGKILRLEFTAFAIWVCGDIETCSCDFVKITDGDGTTLMDNSCGYSDRDPSSSLFFQPPIITTKTNKVDIYFHTDEWGADSGWSLSWTALVEGECYDHVCVSELTRTTKKSGTNESTTASLEQYKFVIVIMLHSAKERNQ